MADEKSYLLDNGQEIICLEVVRSLPGKRLVFVGEYDGAKVFAKLYLDPKRGERHWRRELDGLKAFKERGIATADILYAGKSADQGLPIIILVQLHGLVSVRQAWDEAVDEAKGQLLQRMVGLLARHHQAGLCQTDLHLDNFLLSEEEIFSLDGAGVRVYSDAVPQDVRLDNLALFVAQLAPEWEARIPDIYAIYIAASGWQFGPGSDVLLKKVQTAREHRWKEYRGKLFRNCTAFTYTEYDDGFLVASNRHAGRELFELLRNPDASFPGVEKALKNGNTCTVWPVTVDGLSLVVKRYNMKGFWHGLKLRLFQGRGERSWVNGYRLGFYGIPTPRPVALLKRRTGFFPKTYLVTERVHAVFALEWFRDATVSMDEKGRMAGQIAGMFNKLWQQRITHGDLKATNILIAEGKAMLIDLDGMRRHKCPFIFKWAWRKDMRRFMENWGDDAGLLELFRKSLQSSGIDVDKP